MTGKVFILLRCTLPGMYTPIQGIPMTLYHFKKWPVPTASTMANHMFPRNLRYTEDALSLQNSISRKASHINQLGIMPLKRFHVTTFHRQALQARKQLQPRLLAFMSAHSSLLLDHLEHRVMVQLLAAMKTAKGYEEQHAVQSIIYRYL